MPYVITVGPQSEIAFWRRKGVVDKPPSDKQRWNEFVKESRRINPRDHKFFFSVKAGRK